MKHGVEEENESDGKQRWDDIDDSIQVHRRLLEDNPGQLTPKFWQLKVTFVSFVSLNRMYTPNRLDMVHFLYMLQGTGHQDHGIQESSHEATPSHHPHDHG